MQGASRQSRERDAQSKETEDRRHRVPARLYVAPPPDKEEKRPETDKGRNNHGDS